ncbi:DUF4833 domain-containing protein [Mucilaginibacter myungsuensis]|uniref:DUF4833 domain-containing protein n=1 Tax=Mucilaginibacter myungsuensis TaxID=649104 RepID=A0A929PVK9_9SPHI|nr:DUF4833 domain-containing protein [Mucilaginibacter myungsuensis]MBE9661893.1 DUF4833 domain-containing protein [Mucilaginibacter myungsuensis]MDN3599673.1 DUF4833 domain-containing protein [Mucilaginibacter myungsuensis]
MRLIFSLLLALVTFTGYASNTAKDKIVATDDTVKRNLKKDLVYPNPANVNKLFYVQRDPNTNTLIYELKTDKNGVLDKEEPMHVYWIRYADKGQKEELNYIQRKFAYGLNIKPTRNDEYDVRFVCYKKLGLTLAKDDYGKYRIFGPIAKKQAILNRIFVRVEGGTLFVPNILYVELRGIDPETGKEITERFKP